MLSTIAELPTQVVPLQTAEAISSSRLCRRAPGAAAAGDARLDHLSTNFKDAADIYKKVSNAQLRAFVPGILP